MPRKFNVTGTCFADEHYIADVSDKLAKIRKMVDDGDYFVINRPRQYGKTTTLHFLEQILQKTGEYIVFSISFEGLGDEIFHSEKLFSSVFVELLAQQAESNAPEWTESLIQAAPAADSLNKLSQTITRILKKTSKKVVILIDEVDKSTDNQLFVSFLAMLRNKYLNRKKMKTFHSVVLASVHDVKSLKLKLHPGSDLSGNNPHQEQKYNSPWNIAAEFTIDMNLDPHEIKPMLDDYVLENGVKMDTAKIAQDLFHYTSGYPFLVSKLCKILDEKILPTKASKDWTEEDVADAVRLLLREQSNTNFDSLIKTLENNPDLYRLVFSVIIEGNTTVFNPDTPLISLGLLHGIFAESEQGTLVIHNRIYRERIANMMISKWDEMTLIHPERQSNPHGFKDPFLLPNNCLSLELILLKFQEFMRSEYSRKDRDFLERNGRLVFLAFIKPIINGSGYDFKDPQISEECRLDVIITFYHHRYLVELKIWRGKIAHEKGLSQLANYLNRLAMTEGYLIVFDHAEQKSWQSGWINHLGKRIFVVWV